MDVGIKALKWEKGGGGGGPVNFQYFVYSYP